MSLRDALFELAQSTRARRPQDVQRVIDAALEDLRASGIARSCLQVGETAPDFVLEAAQGSTVALDELLRHGPAVVTFYRGGWCPYCDLTLRALDRIVPDLEALGTRLVAIAPQLEAGMRETADRAGLRFPLLHDRDNHVAQLFGLAFTMPPDLVRLYRGLGIDLPTANGATNWMLPLPATYVIGGDGLVAHAFIDIDYTRRAEPDDIVAAAMRLAKEPVR